MDMWILIVAGGMAAVVIGLLIAILISLVNLLKVFSRVGEVVAVKALSYSKERENLATDPRRQRLRKLRAERIAKETQ